MRFPIVLSVILAAVFAAATLPTSAAAKSPRDEFSLALYKRTSDANGKSGVCVCTGGNLDRRIGHIKRGGVQNGNDVYTVVRCEALLFDPETGELTGTDQCDEGWLALPR